MLHLTQTIHFLESEKQKTKKSISQQFHLPPRILLRIPLCSPPIFLLLITNLLILLFLPLDFRREPISFEGCTMTSCTHSRLSSSCLPFHLSCTSGMRLDVDFVCAVCFVFYFCLGFLVYMLYV